MRRRTVAAALIAVVFFAAGAIALEYYQQPSGGTQTTSQSATTPPTTNASTLFPSCSQQAPSPIWELNASSGRPAVICLRFYYYNSTAPLLLSLPGILTIGEKMPNGSFSSGASNFTVTPNQDRLVLGGPNAENEGALVAYAITAKPGASGTYVVGFRANWMLDSTEPSECVWYGRLAAGNGQPDYVQFTGCITYRVTTQSSGSSTISISTFHTISGIPYPLLDGYLYFQIVGMSNSTS